MDSVDFLQRGMGPTYALYTCNGVESSINAACSPASRSRGASLGPGVAGVVVALLLGALALLPGGGGH